MLSRTEGKNYVILELDEIVPIKVNKKRTDDTLEKRRYREKQKTRKQNNRIRNSYL